MPKFRATKPVAAPEGHSETSGVTGPIVKALTEAGYFAMRLNSGKIRIGRRWLQLCPPGTTDILLCPTGRLPIWIEAKKEGNRTNKEQADNQARFREKVESLGHTWIRATCLEDVLQGLRGNLP